MAEMSTARRPRERWAPLAGAGAVVLWVLGFLAAGAGPDFASATAREWLAFITNDEGKILASRLLFLLGVFLFLFFLGPLRVSLRAGEGESRHWAAVAFGSGVATAVLLIANVTPTLVAAIAADDVLEPAAAQALGVVETAFFVGAEIAAAALVAATGLLAIRSAVLPAWLGWASIGLAVLLLILPIGWAALLIGFPLWVLAVSVLLWRRSDGVAAAGQLTARGVSTLGDQRM